MTSDIAEFEVTMPIWLGIPVKVVPIIANDEWGGSPALHSELADDDGAVVKALDVVRIGDVEEDLVAGEVAAEEVGAEEYAVEGTAELDDGEGLVVGGDGGPASDILGLDVVLGLGLEVQHLSAGCLVGATMARGAARRAGTA
jgi:hypothetical protein